MKEHDGTEREAQVSVKPKDNVTVIFTLRPNDADRLSEDFPAEESKLPLSLAIKSTTPEVRLRRSPTRAGITPGQFIINGINGSENAQVLIDRLTEEFGIESAYIKPKPIPAEGLKRT